MQRLVNARDNLEFLAANGTDAALTTEEETFLAALDPYREKFVASLEDDFNTADAVSVMFELVREVNTATAKEACSKALAKACLDRLLELDGVLGLLYKQEEADDLSAWVEEQIQARQEARKAKNWAEADRIRDELKAKGILLEDTKQGVKWKKA